MKDRRSAKFAIDTTGMPSVFSTSCTADVSVMTSALPPFSMRSNAMRTPEGVAPLALMSDTDSRTEVPALMTSSMMTTRPFKGAPTIVPPSP